MTSHNQTHRANGRGSLFIKEAGGGAGNKEADTNKTDAINSPAHVLSVDGHDQTYKAKRSLRFAPIIIRARGAINRGNPRRTGPSRGEVVLFVRMWAPYVLNIFFYVFLGA